MLTLTRLAQVSHEYIPASCCYLSWVCEQIHILELYDDPECQNPVVISLNVIPRQHHRRDPEGEVWFGNQGLTGLHCLVGSWVLGAKEH